MRKQIRDRKKPGKDAPIWAHMIYKWLIDNNATQDELATKSGLTKGTISQWIYKGVEPKATGLRDIAKAMEVSVDYLLGIDDSPASNIDDRAIAKKTGLSFQAVKQLIESKKSRKLVTELYGLDIINYIVEDDMFWVEIYMIFSMYKNRNASERVDELYLKYKDPENASHRAEVYIEHKEERQAYLKFRLNELFNEFFKSVLEHVIQDDE